MHEFTLQHVNLGNAPGYVKHTQRRVQAGRSGYMNSNNSRIETIMDKRLGALSATALAVILAGCSSGSDAPDTGSLSLSVSDGPVHDAIEVCLEFDEVELKKVGSPPLTITDLTLQQVNLLNYQGTNSAPLFMDIEVEAGEYQWVRLGVNAIRNGSGGQGTPDPMYSAGCTYDGSYVLFGEEELASPYNAYVPSGAQSGLQINGPFVVAQGGATRMTAEFDLEKTLTEPPGLDGDIVVRPSIRLVNDLDVGAVTGTVNTELLGPLDEMTGAPLDCEPTVYVFEDGVDPTMLSAADSIASAIVSNDANPDVYEYTVGFLLPGDYDLAFTCDGVTFDEGIGDATILAGQTDDVHFPVVPD